MMLKVLQDDGMPLYRQLKESLRKRILNDEWKHGDKIPSESELSAEYSVSRVTVRNAIAELENEELLVKKQGKGTFVCQPKIQRKIEHLSSFTSACEANGLKARARIIRRETLDPNEDQQEKLGLVPGERILYIQRLRFADADPIMIENNYFPFNRFRFLLEEPMEGSLYELLKTKHEIVPADAAASKAETPRTTIEVVRANAESASLLRVPVGAPLFHIDTIIFDENGLPIHIGNQFIRGDRYVISLP
jgi:DNA-binding GntR family transcriptional regulator